MADLSTACAALGIAFYSSWKLTLVTLAAFPLAVVLLGLISAQMQANIEAQKKDLTQASKYVHTAIISIDTVKAYNGQEQEVWQYASVIKKAARSYLKQANSTALQMGITRFVIISMFVQSFWFGISLSEKGLNSGAILTTFYACLVATEAAETLLPQWLVIARGMSAGATLKALLLQMRNGKIVLEMGGSGTPSTCYGDIGVTDVSKSIILWTATANSPSGFFFIPLESSSTGARQDEFLFPSRRNHLCHWQEWIGKKHSKQLAPQVLRTIIRRSPHRWRVNPDSGRSLA